MPRNILSILAVAAGSLAATPAFAFSQQAGRHGEGTPIGHEFLTTQSGYEVIYGGAPASRRPAKATNTFVPAATLERLRKIKFDGDDWFRSRHIVIHAAVYGQRWVDLAGMDLVQAKRDSLTGKGPDCFNGVAQNPDNLQHDHYLRQRQETGWEGALTAIAESNARFKKYFVTAATAKPGVLRFRDGGVQPTINYAARTYFLLGRALHLFQDSFSPEHAVRSAGDGYRRVRGIKSYVCTAFSDQHTTHLPVTVAAATDRTGLLKYHDDDIIWRDMSKAARGDAAGTADSNIKDAGLAAIEASKDVWAAFLRVVDLPEAQKAAAAAAEADKIVATWLTPDEPSVRARYPSNRTGKYDGKAPAGVQVLAFTEQLACDDLKASERKTRMELIKREQKQCLANIRPRKQSTGERDEVMGVPYDWEFIKTTWDAQVTAGAAR